jgi:ABC-type sugar transport system ATPase subunit
MRNNASGRIFIGSEDVTELAPARRRVAMVFQSYALFPHLTVAENILFGLRIRKTPAAERSRRLARVAAVRLKAGMACVRADHRDQATTLRARAGGISAL